MNFKPGDLVRVRDWEELAAQYGVDPEGDINVGSWRWFLRKQKYLCGNTFIVKAAGSEAVLLAEADTAVWDAVCELAMPEAEYELEDITDTEFTAIIGGVV